MSDARATERRVHRLWTAAVGTAHYNKSEWKCLQWFVEHSQERTELTTPAVRALLVVLRSKASASPGYNNDEWRALEEEVCHLRVSGVWVSTEEAEDLRLYLEAIKKLGGAL